MIELNADASIKKNLVNTKSFLIVKNFKTVFYATIKIESNCCCSRSIVTDLDFKPWMVHCFGFFLKSNPQRLLGQKTTLSDLTLGGQTHKQSPPTKIDLLLKNLQMQSNNAQDPKLWAWMMFLQIWAQVSKSYLLSSTLSRVFRDNLCSI